MLKLKDKNIDGFTLYIFFYIFIIPWHFSKAQLSITSVILFIWMLIKYKSFIFDKFKNMFKFFPLLLFGSFIVYCYLSSLWSEDILGGFKHVNNFYKYYFLFIPVLLVSLDEEKALIALKLLIFSFALYAIYSILIYLNLIHVAGSNSLNPRGHLRYLIVCQYMVLGFFLSAVFIFYSKNKKEKVLFFITLVLTFIALFINNSRTAQLSFLIIFIFLIIVFFRNKVFSLKALLILLVIICTISFYFYNNKNKLNRYKVAYNELKLSLNKNQYKGSFGLRLYFNKAGIKIFENNPFIGTGPTDNRQLLQKMQKEDPLYNSRIINHFHSEHMDTLTAYGLIGYLLLFSSIVILIYKLRKKELYFYLSLSVFLTLFINSFANKTLSVKPLNYVYIIFFVLFAIIAYKNEKKVENS